MYTMKRSPYRLLSTLPSKKSPSGLPHDNLSGIYYPLFFPPEISYMDDSNPHRYVPELLLDLILSYF